MSLKLMTGKELIKKIYIEKERDLQRIKLKEGTDLTSLDGYSEMNDYLRKQDLQKTPVLIDGADFSYVKASGLFLHCVQGQNVIFYRANILGACLRGADFEGANLQGANLEGANLQGANLDGANLQGANLWGVDLMSAYLKHAKLGFANLRGANLQGANLEGANLWGVDLWGAKLWGAKLIQTNLCEVKNLTSAHNLKNANLLEVKVASDDAETIRAIMEAVGKRRYFIKVD